MKHAKKHASRIVASCLLLALLAAFAWVGLGHVRTTAAHPKVGASGQTVVSVVGDSLAAGYYADCTCQRFMYLFEQHFPNPVEFNAPYSGPGAPAVLLSQDFANGLTYVRTDSNYVVVELGTNDFGQNVSTSQFSAAMDNIVWWVHAVYAPQATLLCLSTWNTGGLNQVGEYGGQFDAAIKAACATQNGIYVPLSPYTSDVGPAGRNTPWGVSDGFHPNAVGHARIASAMLCLIQGQGCQA